MCVCNASDDRCSIPPRPSARRFDILCSVPRLPIQKRYCEDTKGAVARMAKLIVFMAVLLTLFTIDSIGHARCFCQCVGGRMVPLCESTSDIRPACAPSLCGPSIPRVNTDHGSVSAEKRCERRQLCDSYGRCRLREICR